MENENREKIKLIHNVSWMPGSDPSVPEFIGRDSVAGKGYELRMWRKRDFLGNIYLLIRFGYEEGDLGCLHVNSHRTDRNKAPELTGRCTVNRKMYRMVAWQNIDYRGMPLLSVLLEPWEEYQKEQEEYRKHREQVSGFNNIMTVDNSGDIPF